MRTLKLLLLILIGYLQAYSQGYSKINIDLFLQLQEISPSNHSKVFIPALVKGDISSIQSVLEQNDGIYKYHEGNIAAVSINLATVKKLIEHPSVERVESQRTPMQSLFYEDSIMHTNNNLGPAHNGEGGLPRGFQGEGVLVGIIDDGFEWRHPDFLNADNSTRIMHLWDQESTNPNYLDPYYGYGAIFDSATINAGYCTHNPGMHGTHVMGTAVGNGRAANKLVGVAPKSDILCVNILSGTNFLSAFVDGVRFMFDKATQLGKPCAINSSVGTYTGSHDGRDLYSQIIDSMLLAAPGRALVQAAGNAREVNIHLGVELNGDSSKTWFKNDPYRNITHFLLYSDTSDFNNIDFSFQLIHQNTYLTQGQSQVYNILQDFTFTNTVDTIEEVLFMLGTTPITLTIYAAKYNGLYEIYCKAPSIANYYWQFKSKGVGKFDAWCDPLKLGTSQVVQNGNGADYQSADNIQTIVGYWTCSDNVLTVSSYQNREYIYNYLGDTLDISTGTHPLYGISHFSSLGPTRDVRQKPDITAPGGQVLSAVPLADLAYIKTSVDAKHLDKAGWHRSSRGTSMAAPMVAGAAALYFECNPQATVTEVKNALTSSARIDNYVFQQVFALPNIHWGYGKLDVYELLKGCLVYGCTDSTAINYNSSANVMDSSCVYLVTSVPEIQKTDQLFRVSPNPFGAQTQISYKLPNAKSSATFVLYNSIGQKVAQQLLQKAEGSFILQNYNLAKGVYLGCLFVEGQCIERQKIVHR
ncbi:MAG: S8 family serine peptidase [Aureispira sp.]|nr:S8 family serine peptidase [Aureispira sp.]